MSRAEDLAKLSFSELSRSCTPAEWRGFLWWLHSRDERYRPEGGDVGVEIARLKIESEQRAKAGHPAFVANICGTLIDHPEHDGITRVFAACPLCARAKAVR